MTVEEAFDIYINSQWPPAEVDGERAAFYHAWNVSKAVALRQVQESLDSLKGLRY